jgi:hypothetical protein
VCFESTLSLPTRLGMRPASKEMCWTARSPWQGDEARDQHQRPRMGAQSVRVSQRPAQYKNPLTGSTLLDRCRRAPPASAPAAAGAPAAARPATATFACAGAGRQSRRPAQRAACCRRPRRCRCRCCRVAPRWRRRQPPPAPGRTAPPHLMFWEMKRRPPAQWMGLAWHSLHAGRSMTRKALTESCVREGMH